MRSLAHLILLAACALPAALARPVTGPLLATRTVAVRSANPDPAPWGAPTPTTTVTITSTSPAPPSQSCSTGSVQCCQSLLPANDSAVSQLLGLLGIVLGDITGLIGLDCSPFTVVGIGSGNACSANAVCCTNNNVVSLRETT